MLLCVIIRFFAFILLCECFFFFVLVRFSFHLHCLFTSHVRIVSLVTFFISFIYFFASFSAISLRKRVYEFYFFPFFFWHVNTQSIEFTLVPVCLQETNCKLIHENRYVHCTLYSIIWNGGMVWKYKANIIYGHVFCNMTKNAFKSLHTQL